MIPNEMFRKLSHHHFLSKTLSILLIQSFNFRQLASVVIFLTDVPSGGEIVFPFLGVDVKPMTRSATFWFNLHIDGTLDVRTRYASCPFLYCNKWTLVQEIDYRGNKIF